MCNQSRSHQSRSQRSNSQPSIIKIDMLDSDYAKMIAGETIAIDRRDRLEDIDTYTLNRLGKQISRYRYGNLDQIGKDDILCDIGLTAELLTRSDMEDIHQRNRESGYFYLTESERLQVLNWLKDELAVDLAALAPKATPL
ncbi:hypothetical protein [cf. Phormidesmis sp. LEGE 11477]|uniref:hypothetical protein n=1 Tax=cf. Phormidesmis sp. LEGE 11477 TaxID=1828680 RepID=UPI001882360D|nr:hypothetical protein [cf. Phormidesmis sp. LEGE 11477]MBE9064928.1 hypothetical protein [cf. Phormidesmis sp. LEGE 11477]